VHLKYLLILNCLQDLEKNVSIIDKFLCFTSLESCSDEVTHLRSLREKAMLIYKTDRKTCESLQDKELAIFPPPLPVK